MDHAEARAQLELAAAEPGGLDRLTAGDTPDAAALAGHLAGCPDCVAEMTRLRLAAGAIRQVVRTTAPPDLRERTLAFVAALGRERLAAPLADEGVTLGSRSGQGLDRGQPAPARPRPAWLAALAAVLVLAVAGTAVLMDRQADGRLAERDRTVAILEQLATWNLRIAGEPDARLVQLTPPDGSNVAGRLLFSPGTRELVVVATNLPAPPPGREFRCWVEIDGQRVRVGRMNRAGDLAFWLGPVEALADLPPRARFGVSLVETEGSSLEGPPVLVGSL